MLTSYRSQFYIRERKKFCAQRKGLNTIPLGVILQRWRMAICSLYFSRQFPQNPSKLIIIICKFLLGIFEPIRVQCKQKINNKSTNNRKRGICTVLTPSSIDFLLSISSVRVSIFVRTDARGGLVSKTQLESQLEIFLFKTVFTIQILHFRDNTAIFLISTIN